MSLQFSPTLRNAFLDSIRAVIGPGANLDIWSGSQPDSCLYPPTGYLIASFQLPDEWITKAGDGIADGTVEFLVPQTTTALISGKPGYFRVLSADRNYCGLQGTAGAANASSPPDLVLANPTTIAGQIITIASLRLTAPGA